MGTAPETGMSAAAARIRECTADGRKVAVVGVGAQLKRDDFAGVRVAEAVNARVHPLIKGFAGHNAPENITGEIVSFAPALVVFVDAAALGLSAGEARVIERAEMGGVSFCTHTLPLQLIMDYLAQALGCAFLVLGIQPKDISFGEGLSPEVQAAADRIAAALTGV